MFPGHSAGAALLILLTCWSIFDPVDTLGRWRLCTVGSIGACTYIHRYFASAPWAETAIGALIVALLIGLLTPIACGLGVLLELFYLIHSHGTDAGHVITALFVTLALGILGPGAFSLDARLFGRRRLIVPSR